MRDYEEMLAVFKAGFRARFDAPGLLRPEGDEAIRAGIAAVIRALRDEFENEMGKCLDCSASGVHDHLDEVFNRILGDAESGKVAGASAREGEAAGLEQPRAARTPATDTAPDKNWTGALQWEDACRSVASLPDLAPDECEWTDVGDKYQSACGRSHFAWTSRDGVVVCPACKKPISFNTEAQR